MSETEEKKPFPLMTLISQKKIIKKKLISPPSGEVLSVPGSDQLEIHGSVWNQHYDHQIWIPLSFYNVIQSRDLCNGHLAQTYGHLKDISF